MANETTLAGSSKKNSIDDTYTNYLVSQFGSSVQNVDDGTQFNVNIGETFVSPSQPRERSEFTSFLDYIFHTNRAGPNLVLDTLTDSNSLWERINVQYMPVSRFIENWNNRVYVAHSRFVLDQSLSNSVGLEAGYHNWNPLYRNRVFFSEFPENRVLKWGVVSGNNIQKQGDDVLGMSNFFPDVPYFISNGIKVGDPIYVHASGSLDVPFVNKFSQFTVREVIDEYRLRTVEKIGTTSLVSRFWVGSNWFDVNPGDNDEITALSKNNNRLMIFKVNSLWRYDNSSVVQVKGVPGTTSSRSVKNIRGFTIYFHGNLTTKDKTGFYLYDGVTSQKISNSVNSFIQGMDTDNYTEVVGWVEGDTYRAFIGDLSNKNSNNNAYNISRTKAVFTFDVVTQRVSVDSFADNITASLQFEEETQTKAFIADDAGQVFQTPLGNSFNGTDIPWRLETKVYYPRGTSIKNNFTRIQIASRDARGVKVQYKLWGTPLKIDDEYQPLGDIENEFTELTVPIRNSGAKGIQLLFTEIGNKEPTQRIESINIFSIPDQVNTPEIKFQS